MHLKIHSKILLVSLIIGLNTSFACSQSKLKIVDKTVCFGMQPTENRNIDAIIIHSVYNALGGDKYDVDLVINEFSHYKVSSHYIIGRDGTIYQLVEEKNISYHAGKSSLPDGNTKVNSCSIGIELITTNDSLDSPTELQLKSLTALVRDIQNRYKIKYILRHSDIAPGRKTDPWNMDWEDFLKRIN